MKHILTTLLLLFYGTFLSAQCQIDFELDLSFVPQPHLSCEDNITKLHITLDENNSFSGSYQVLYNSNLIYTGSEQSLLLDIASNNEDAVLSIRDTSDPFCVQEQAFFNGPIAVSINQSSNNCTITDGIILEASNSEDRPMQYHWSTGQTGATTNVFMPGTYAVTATPTGDSTLIRFGSTPSSLNFQTAQNQQIMGIFSSVFSRFENTDNNDTPLHFSLKNVASEQGQDFCIPLQVYQFKQIKTFDIGISYDTELFSLSYIDVYEDVLPNASNDNIDSNTAGHLQFNWTSDNTDGNSLNNGATIAELCFTALAHGAQQIDFSEALNPINATNHENESVAITNKAAQVYLKESIANTETFSIQVQDAFARAQDLAIVPVYVSGLENLHAISFNLSYDPEQLLPVETRLTDNLIGGSFSTNITANVINFEWEGGNTPIGDATAIVHFYFHVLEESETVIDLNLVTGDIIPTHVITGDNEFVTPEMMSDGHIYVDNEHPITSIDAAEEGIDPISVILEDELVPYGEAYCMSIRTFNFVDVADFFFKLTFDTTALNFVGASSFSQQLAAWDENAFSFTNNNELNFDWTHPQNENTSLANGSVLASICFEPLYESCPIVANYELSDEGSDCNLLEGYVYNSDDCNTEGNALANWMIAISSAEQVEYVLSDENGYYAAYLTAGDYNIALIPPSTAWESCQSNLSLNVVANHDVYQQNLFARAVEDCPLLEISTNIVSPLRPCWQNARVDIGYQNVGTSTMESPLIAVVLPHHLSYASSGIAPTSISTDTIYFELDHALNIGEGGQFSLYVDVSCDVAAGATLCVRTLGLPYGPCPSASEQWSGASLQAQGNCTEENVEFSIRNIGTATMAEAGSYIVIQDGVMLLEASNSFPALAPDEAFTLDYPANGSTYRIEVMQEAFHPGQSMPVAVVEGCASSSDDEISYGFVQQFFNDDFDVHIDEDCREVTAAYDPNDKQAEPKGYGDAHYVNIDQEMEYTIRFQNTGTDTAFLVVIRDTLSEHLDMTTLRLAGSSHPFELQLDSANAISFVFENILLPDSTTNLAASQGFVKYKIKPLADIARETVVENTAAIYFDHNEPVITNTTQHTFGEHFIDVVSWTQNYSQEGKWQVFPNPVQNQLTILQESRQENSLLIISDALGRTRLEQQLSVGSNSIKLNQLQAGWYSFQIKSETGLVLGTGRLIKIN